jgi:triosephosphate isomerase
MLVVNLKTYDAATGERAAEIAEKCYRAGAETGEKVIVSPQPQDMLRIEGGEVFSQHMDAVEPGSHTGHLLGESIKASGASGTLLNHSERRITNKKIEAAVERADELGLTTIVCAQSPEECGELSELGPDYVAFEPPELIGGDTSVSDAKPELIEEAVKLSEVPVLTGAGIKNTEDVEKSKELGCKGVLVASGVVKAEDTFEEAKSLCDGL